MGSKEYQYFTLKFSKIENAQKICFLLQNGLKMTPQNPQNELILTENYNFWGHLSTVGPENARKCWRYQVENNALTLPNQLQNNFEKVEKMTFSTPKMVKNDPSKQSN